MPKLNVSTSMKIIADCLLLIIIALPILLFFLFGKPFKRGFYCDDDSIRYPFHDSTVTSGALYAFGTLIPLISMTIVEYVHVRKTDVLASTGVKLSKLLWPLYHYVGIFLFGCAISHFSVDICKYSIGRLRPHFIDVCKPDWTKIDCKTQGVYVEDFECTNEKDPGFADNLRESRLSFISGHASFSTFTMFYLIFYLQFRYFARRRFVLSRPVLQFFCFSIALFTSLSRVSDYKHHWSDVLAGFLNGLAFAVFVAFWLGDFRSRSRPSVSCVESNRTNNHSSEMVQNINV